MGVSEWLTASAEKRQRACAEAGGGCLRSAVRVVSPAAQHWMVHMAVGLARAGLLGEFVVPIGSTTSKLAPPARWLLPGYVTERVERDLRRRQLPPNLGIKTINPKAAALLECLCVAASRAGGPLRCALPL